MLFIYIHGFNSSPKSFKSQCFKYFLEKNYPHDDFISPELSFQPFKAISALIEGVEQHINVDQISLIGSSLGGFYATWLAQKYDLKAVLVNPAVNPHELLVDYLGKNINYHTDAEYEFTHEHIQQLKQLVVDDLHSPKNIMVMLQTQDEVLDYRLAKLKYAKTNLMIETGGDHSFHNFAQHCEPIYHFLCVD